jgi:AcrR family transcriptional regulator
MRGWNHASARSVSVPKRSEGSRQNRPRPTLADDAKRSAQGRILDGAKAALAQFGLRATIDQVAEISGVSRRTIFRHFGSHRRLIMAACSEIWEEYQRDLSAVPQDGDLRAWLRESAIGMHQHHARMGALCVDVYGATRLDGEMEDWRAQCLARQSETVSDFTHNAWHMAKRKGNPPGWVTDTYRVLLAPFARNVLAKGSNVAPEQAGTIAARAMYALLTSPDGHLV